MVVVGLNGSKMTDYVQSDNFFQKIMLAVMPVKSGLRSYGGLLRKKKRI